MSPSDVDPHPSYATSGIATACRWLVRLAAVVVPWHRRTEWRAEWNAEMWELWHRAARLPRRYPDREASMIRFALGSIPHAFAEWRAAWTPDLIGRDVRYAVRSLARSRGFALTSVLLIALGVGANTTVFTLVNAVLLRAPTGIEEPAGLVQLGRTDEPGEFDSWSYPLYQDFSRHNTVFSDVAAHATRDVVIGRGEELEPATAQLVSASYFRMLGTRMATGRGFVDDEDQAPGGEAVAVISHGLWQRRFALVPDVIDRSITIRGREFRIVGVTAPDFAGADVGAAKPDVWIPLALAGSVLDGSTERLYTPMNSWLWVIARLRPGVSPTQAEGEMRTLFRRLQTDDGGHVRDDLALVQGLGLRPAERAMAARMSASLLAIVGFVLVIACSNLAALLLARGTTRRGELAVRLAIGASRGRVVRQLVTETIAIAALGSLAAFALTYASARWVTSIFPYDISVSLTPDVRVLSFALGIGIGTGVLFGLVPAWQAARPDLLSLLRTGAPGLAASRRGRLRPGLVVFQVALSFVLLASTGLLLRTLQAVNRTDPGFRTDDVFVGELDLTAARRPAADAVAQFGAIAGEIARLPGVQGVALASSVPASGTLGSRTMWRPDDPGDGALPPNVSTVVVDTGYFHTMGVRIARGRQFDVALDAPGEPTSIIINQRLAQRLWPDADPIGREIGYGSLEGPRTVRVVGIAADTKTRSIRGPTTPLAYLPIAQHPSARTLLHVRVAAPRSPVAATLAAEIRRVGGAMPVPRFDLVRERIGRSLADVRLIAELGTVFGVLALALAATGLYGVVAYDSARRSREFGVRLALGAAPREIGRLVLGQSARLAAAGVVLGALGAVAAAPLLRSSLYGVSPLDSLTYIAITALLGATAAVAALIPAARAARSDPMRALRQE